MMRMILRAGAVCLLLLLIFAAAFYLDPIAFTDAHLRFNLWREDVHSRYAVLDRYQIHYFEAGPADGTPLVLIHGLGGRGEDWTTILPFFAAKGFHVYAPDLLGYGRSATPDVDYSITLEENVVAHFMQRMGVQKADVCGWSMGGWVAAKFTLDHPEMVDRLVLYDSVGIYFPATFDASLFSPIDSAGLDRLLDRLQPVHVKLPEFAIRAALRVLKKKAWVVGRSVAAMSSGRDLLDFRLNRIRQPTLIVWGSKDALIPPYVGESMHHMIPDSSLIMIEGCGHLAPVQCTKPIVASTLKFLQAEPPWKNVEQTLPGR